MGMFGKSAVGYGGPSGWADKLSIIGAALKDASPDSTGDNLLNIQGLLGARQKEAEKAQFLQMLSGKLGPQYDGGSPPPTVAQPRGLIGGSAPTSIGDPMAAITQATGGMAPGPAPEAPTPYRYQPPQRTSDGLNMNSPELPQIAMLAQEAGVPIDSLLKVFAGQQPDVQVGPDGTTYNKKDAASLGRTYANRDNINGFLVNKNDPANEGRYFPKLPDGIAPDGQGGVGNLPGLLPAMGGQTQAETTGRTRGTMLSVPQSDGSTRLMLGADYLSPRSTPPASGPAPTVGVSQSPAAAAAAKIEAEAGANARVDLPRLTQTSNQAVSLIDQMLKHPSLKARTGMSGLLPAFAGTKDAGFDAMDRQIHGKTFLEAFQSLKGAGQITEVEGAKATDAIARLDRAQSAEDYSAALTDLRSVIVTGMDRAKTMAGGQRPSPASTGPRTQGFRSRIIEVH